MNYRTFETDRLFIRPTVEEDAAFILELLNTPKWIQFVGDRNVHTEADAQNYIRMRMMPQLERLGYSNNTVILKEGMVKIGSPLAAARMLMPWLDMDSWMSNISKPGWSGTRSPTCSASPCPQPVEYNPLPSSSTTIAP